MAQSNNKGKKVIKTIGSKENDQKFVSNAGNSSSAEPFLYGKDYYMWMLIGLACIILGFILMAGGNQAPGEWNVDEIYSFRRTALAPIVIVIGLVIEVYAIFKK